MLIVIACNRFIHVGVEMVTFERLIELLHYCPKTGVFTHKRRASSRAPLGSQAGYIDKSTGYIRIGIDDGEYYAHRLVWLYMTRTWPEHQIDHRNRIRHDNRWRNLRNATQNQNKKNQSKRSDTSSKYIGVTWHKGANKWMAQIVANGKRYYLGLHMSELAAFQAYKNASVMLHGDFSSISESPCHTRTPTISSIPTIQKSSNGG